LCFLFTFFKLTVGLIILYLEKRCLGVEGTTAYYFKITTVLFKTKFLYVSVHFEYPVVSSLSIISVSSKQKQILSPKLGGRMESGARQEEEEEPYFFDCPD
jgi:uncharacterized membrane protein